MENDGKVLLVKGVRYEKNEDKMVVHSNLEKYFTLNDDVVNGDGHFQATLSNGLLVITVPKKKIKNNRREIPISSLEENVDNIVELHNEKSLGNEDDDLEIIE